MRPKRRLFIILAFSFCLHLALLMVQFQRDGASVTGSRHLTGLVSRHLSGFVPLVVHPAPLIAQKKTSDHHANQAEVKHSSPRNKPVSLTPEPDGPPVAQKSIRKNTTDAVAQVATVTISREPSVEVSRDSSAESFQKSSVAGPTAAAAVSPPTKTATTGGMALRKAVITRALPQYAVNPRPIYPEIARRRGWQGEVQLLVRVDSVGDVARLSVKQTSGHLILDRVATQSVRLWRFVPATSDGQKVPSEVVVPINFHLPDKDLSRQPKISAVFK